MLKLRSDKSEPVVLKTSKLQKPNDHSIIALTLLSYSFDENTHSRRKTIAV